jgi:hypothetical protein
VKLFTSKIKNNLMIKNRTIGNSIFCFYSFNNKMKLKKINEKLQKDELKTARSQYYKKKLFCLKSGADCIAPKGKRKSILLSCDPTILFCGGTITACALIIVEDKGKVLEMEAIFENSKGILIWWFTECMIEAIWNSKIIYFWWS